MHEGVVDASPVDANVARAVAAVLDQVVLHEVSTLASGVPVPPGNASVAMRIRPQVLALNRIRGPGAAVVQGPGLHGGQGRHELEGLVVEEGRGLTPPGRDEGVVAARYRED